MWTDDLAPSDPDSLMTDGSNGSNDEVLKVISSLQNFLLLLTLP